MRACDVTCWTVIVLLSGYLHVVYFSLSGHTLKEKKSQKVSLWLLSVKLDVACGATLLIMSMEAKDNTANMCVCV